MYEGVAVIEGKEESRLLIHIAQHNITDQKITDGLCALLQRDGHKVVIFEHALLHPTAPFGCSSCLAAIDTRLHIAKEKREEENARRGGNPPPFDPSAKGLALVEHQSLDQAPSTTSRDDVTP